MSGDKTEMKGKSKGLRYLGIAVIVVALVAGSVLAMLFAAEKHTGTPEFCGLQCHIMKPNYDAWKNDKHSLPAKETGKVTLCIDCHYKPGERPTTKAKFKGLGQLFSYLSTGEKEVWKRAAVSDQSCSVPDCHPLDKHATKPLDYIKKYRTDYKGQLKPFTHKTHFDKTIDGQKLHCTSCHFHTSPEKHFNVPEDICFLCHFRKAKENEGRAKCSICHEIPEKPLQVKNAGGEGADDQPKKPITHKSLEEAKVACNRCHLEMIMGSTRIRMDYCSECHHYPSKELLEKGKDKVVMHQEHVTKHTARCSQCHETISHKKSSYLDAAVKDCAACHPEPHLYTKQLLAGDSGMGVDMQYPSLMHSFGTTCIGCHQKDGRDAKGNKVKKASNQMCVECHHRDKRYETMTAKWSQDVKEFLAEAQEAEQAALAAYDELKAGGKVPARALSATAGKLKLAQETLRVVAAGGGVHNKKYSMLLLDMAVQGFEEAQSEITALAERNAAAEPEMAPTPKGGKDEN